MNQGKIERIKFKTKGELILFTKESSLAIGLTVVKNNESLQQHTTERMKTIHKRGLPGIFMTTIFQQGFVSRLVTIYVVSNCYLDT